MCMHDSYGGMDNECDCVGSEPASLQSEVNELHLQDHLHPFYV